MSNMEEPEPPESNPPKPPRKLVDTDDPAWLLAQAQSSIKAYILSLLSSSNSADDILQAHCAK